MCFFAAKVCKIFHQPFLPIKENYQFWPYSSPFLSHFYFPTIDSILHVIVKYQGGEISITWWNMMRIRRMMMRQHLSLLPQPKCRSFRTLSVAARDLRTCVVSRECHFLLTDCPFLPIAFMVAYRSKRKKKQCFKFENFLHIPHSSLVQKTTLIFWIS